MYVSLQSHSDSFSRYATGRRIYITGCRMESFSRFELYLNKNQLQKSESQVEASYKSNSFLAMASLVFW